MKSKMERFDRRLEIPELCTADLRSICRWYDNVALEISAGWMSDSSTAYITKYFSEAGLLQSWRRSFFYRHYAESLLEVVRFIFSETSSPRILDLGCGTGTQSLLFAILGASVVSVDLDDQALEVFSERVKFYERELGRRLPIRIERANAFEVDYDGIGPFDSVYSLFAFNIMQPSSRLVDRLVPSLSPKARWAVLDGNNTSVWCRVMPWRWRPVWTPTEMAEELRARGFEIVAQRGGIAVPPIVWTAFPRRFVRAMDIAICRRMTWPVSCQTLAVRTVC